MTSTPGSPPARSSSSASAATGWRREWSWRPPPWSPSGARSPPTPARRCRPDDLIPVERVDAVVPGGDLGLDLADDLELLRPFGMGNPQPTLLVPAARFERVTGMGEDKEHSRFTLVAAGGAKSRGVAFGSPPKALAPAADRAHDIALRLERNRWNGMVEPRVILRALCPTEPGQLDVLGEDAPFWDELGALLAAPAARARRRGRRLRRRRRGPPRRGLRRRGRRPLLERRDRAGRGGGRAAPSRGPRGRGGGPVRRPDAGHLLGSARRTPGARRAASTTWWRSTRRRAAAAIRSWAASLARISPGARPRPSSRSPPGAPSSTCARSSPRSTARCASCRRMPPRRTSKRPCAGPAAIPATRAPAPASPACSQSSA